MGMINIQSTPPLNVKICCTKLIPRRLARPGTVIIPLKLSILFFIVIATTTVVMRKCAPQHLIPPIYYSCDEGNSHQDNPQPTNNDTAVFFYLLLNRNHYYQLIALKTCHKHRKYEVGILRRDNLFIQ